MKDYLKVFGYIIWLPAILAYFLIYLKTPPVEFFATIGFLMVFAFAGYAVLTLCYAVFIDLYNKYSRTVTAVSRNTKIFKRFEKWCAENDEKLD